MLCGSGRVQIFEFRHRVLRYTTQAGQRFFYKTTQMRVLRREDVSAFRLAEKIDDGSRRVAGRNRKCRMPRAEDAEDGGCIRDRVCTTKAGSAYVKRVLSQSDR